MLGSLMAQIISGSKINKIFEAKRGCGEEK